MLGDGAGRYGVPDVSWRQLPGLITKLPRAIAEQRREVRGLAETIPKMDARLEFLPMIDERLADLDARLHALSERVSDTHIWRLTTDIDLVRGEEGLFLVLRRDDGISQVIRTTGVWGPHDVRLFRRLIRAGDYIIDVGANLGHHTVLLSRLVGPAGSVLAVEPQTLMYQLLNANLVLNGCTNVTAERCAAGEEAGFVKLWPVDYTVGDNYGALGVSRQEGRLVMEHGGETVPVLRLDELVARLGWQKLDFMKVDAQTYDLYVLLGAEGTVRSKRPLIFVEVSPYWMRRTGYDYREIYRFLQRMDYLVYEPHRSLDEPAPVREWSGDQGEEWDLLAVPGERTGLAPWRGPQD